MEDGCDHRSDGESNHQSNHNPADRLEAPPDPKDAQVEKQDGNLGQAESNLVEDLGKEVELESLRHQLVWQFIAKRCQYCPVVGPNMVPIVASGNEAS